MPQPLVTQLNIVEGHSQEEGPFTYALRLRGEGEPAYLFLLLEAGGPNPEETCAEAAQTLLQTFEEGRLSTTGRLLEALKRVHQILLVENQSSLLQHRRTLGAVCSYLRGDQLYLAHAGPTLAYVIGPQGGRRLAPAPGAPSPGLGSLGEPAIWVRHHQLLPGERVFLAASPLAREGTDNGVFSGFRQHLEAGMIAVYRRAHAWESFAALAIDPGIGREESLDYEQPFGAREGGGSVPFSPPSLNNRAPSPSPGPASVDAAPLVAQESSLSLPLTQTSPRRWVSRYARDLFPLQLLPALGALFLVGGLLLAGRAVAQRIEQQTKAQAEGLVQEAADFRAKAQAATTGDARRQLLNQALEKLQKAQKQDAANADAARLLEEVQATLTRLDAVYQLADLRTLVDFTAAMGGPVLLRDLEYQGNLLYLLDKVGDRVFQVTVPAGASAASSPTPRVLPQTQGNPRRNLARLVWMPRGNTWPRDSLLVLDDGRGIQEIGPGQEPRSLPLRGAQEWASFQAAAGFGGSLYILDPKASQVWRYVPTDQGFDSERRAVPPSLDLRDAVDLAVEGDLYLLLRTGKVLKVSNGRSQPFSQDGLDRPILNPVDLFVAPTSKALYVVDAGSKRIVVFDKGGGKYLRQYDLASLPQVQGLWVEEERGVLFLISDTRLYTASLPQG